MTKQGWAVVGGIAVVGTVVVALHGIKSRKWQDAHIFFSAVGTLATAASVANLLPPLSEWW